MAAACVRLERSGGPLATVRRTSTDSSIGDGPATLPAVLRCTLLLAMTAKEKLLQRAPRWSEEQAERALRAAESDDDGDEWGDLSKLHEASSAETMRRLADDEQAAGHEPW